MNVERGLADVIDPQQEGEPASEVRILKRLSDLAEGYRARSEELEERMGRTQEEEAFLIFHCGATWALLEAGMSVERMLGVRK